jgi:hypothetical protein
VQGITVRYEEFCQKPFDVIISLATELKLEPSSLTAVHLKNVKKFIKPNDEISIKLKDISEPERTKFTETMEKLGYV